MTSTLLDIEEFILWRRHLHARGEVARNLRNTGHLAEAETVLLALLKEAEDRCGVFSTHLSDFLKSLGILFSLQKGREQEAEQAFVRMDSLRDRENVDYVVLDAMTTPQEDRRNDPTSPLMNVLTSDLDRLIPAQLAMQHFADARKSVGRLRELLERCGASNPQLKIWTRQAAGKANVTAPPLEACAHCRQRGNLRVCTGCRSIKYCSSVCQKKAWKGHKAVCRAIKNETKVSTKKSIVPSEEEGKDQSATADDELLTAIKQNAASSRTIAPDSPSVLAAPLRAAIADPQLCYFFRIGDVCSTRVLARDGGTRRFLATTGVLSCITVFAWAPSGVSVAAHVHLAAVLRGSRLCKITKTDLDRTLLPLTNELRECFQDTDPKSVRITFVGGHRTADLSQALLEIGRWPVVQSLHYGAAQTVGNRGLFSWYVQAACRGAGLATAVFDTTLLNAFDGEPCVNLETEIRLRRTNQRFEYTALDTHTGHVVTHTQFIEPDGRVCVLSEDSREWRRQFQRYNELDVAGDPLTLVSHGES